MVRIIVIVHFSFQVIQTQPTTRPVVVDIKPPNYVISSVTGDDLRLLDMWTHSPDLCSTGGQTFWFV